MGVYISGMEIPMSCGECYVGFCKQIGCELSIGFDDYKISRHPNCPLAPVPPHGRLIDADALRREMYHKAFETDSDMQKWESGCWIRYKMFERIEEAAPTVIEAEDNDETDT